LLTVTAHQFRQIEINFVALAIGDQDNAVPVSDFPTYRGYAYGYLRGALYFGLVMGVESNLDPPKPEPDYD
jgi:hypothetical protein